MNNLKEKPFIPFAAAFSSNTLAIVNGRTYAIHSTDFPLWYRLHNANFYRTDDGINLVTGFIALDDGGGLFPGHVTLL